jgi:hypothetical protein
MIRVYRKTRKHFRRTVPTGAEFALTQRVEGAGNILHKGN